jgi:hypothetical protein
MPMLRRSEEVKKARLSEGLVAATLLVLLGTLIYLAFPREKVLSTSIQLGVVLVCALAISLVALLPAGWLSDKKKHR